MKHNADRYPHHQALAEPWTYRVVGDDFRCDPKTPAIGWLDLAPAKGASTVTLRFTGVYALEIEEGFPGEEDNSYNELRLDGTKNWDYTISSPGRLSIPK